MAEAGWLMEAPVRSRELGPLLPGLPPPGLLLASWLPISHCGLGSIGLCYSSLEQDTYTGLVSCIVVFQLVYVLHKAQQKFLCFYNLGQLLFLRHESWRIQVQLMPIVPWLSDLI